MDVLGILIPSACSWAFWGWARSSGFSNAGSSTTPKATRTASSATITRTGPRSRGGEGREFFVWETPRPLAWKTARQGPKVSQGMLRAPNRAQARSAWSSVMPANRAS
jgi:hypothetical protein